MVRLEERFPYDKDGWDLIFEIKYLNEKFKSHFILAFIILCLCGCAYGLQRMTCRSRSMLVLGTKLKLSGLAEALSLPELSHVGFC